MEGGTYIIEFGVKMNITGISNMVDSQSKIFDQKSTYSKEIIVF
jgi:hypothetical protein